MVRMKLALSLLGAVGLVAGCLAATPAGAVTPPRTTLPGSVPSWATAHNRVGAADSSTDVGFRVYLGWSDPAAATALAQAVSDPNSASYGQYLTPAQFRSRFAPTQTEVGAVQSWLRGQGFDVQYTPLNYHYVSAEGTLAQAAAAFGVSFGMYTVYGLTVRSPSSNLSMPSSFAGLVSGVVGLDDSAQLVRANHISGDAPPAPAFVNAPPCSTFWAEQLATGVDAGHVAHVRARRMT